MKFSFHGISDDDRFAGFGEGLRRTMESEGHEWVGDPDEARLVFNFFDRDAPRSFRRKARDVFVVGVTRHAAPFDEPFKSGYPLLIRSLSNLLVVLVGDDARPPVHFLTLERGHYEVPWEGDEGEYLERIYGRVAPLASSTLVIDNVFDRDLPRELWDGDEVTASISRAARRLDDLELLPAPFPMNEILPRRLMRHVDRLYGMGGLSYGNVSARKDEERFWMSASGVDKSKLDEVGTEILLVKDYDPERNAMILSVPPEVEPTRVSVDAIEHWMIYREHPEVGAILHVHAWMEEIPSTEINYPCGTFELGKAVADIVREAEAPDRAVVGLKNHGLTITGSSLDEIFDRIEGRILRQVPMA